MAYERVEVRLPVAGGTRHLTFLLDPARRTQADILAAFKEGRPYELHTSRLVVELLRPGDGFIDVGTHVGYYALLAFAAAGPDAPILAFEPNPETYRTLVLNLAANRAGRVHAFNCAVGDRAETLTFHINDDNEGESALWDVASDARYARTAARPRTTSVSCLPLDMVAGFEPFARARMIKIDAEGWEGRVLAGAHGLLNRHRPPLVICEINRTALARGGTSEAAIRRHMAGLGYGCSLINLSGTDLCGGKSLRKLADGDTIDTPYVFNLLFSLYEVDL